MSSAFRRSSPTSTTSSSSRSATPQTSTDTYRFLPAASFEGTQYGVAFGGNANGVVYNKRIFDEAGMTELPTTEEEWLDALQKVKDNTDAIPLYTNYKDGWPLSQSFGNLGVVTNDPDAPDHHGAR